MGAMSGMAPEEDKTHFDDTGQGLNKIFVLPDKQQHKAMKTMLLQQPLRESARELNIVPGLHSTLVSIPKLAKLMPNTQQYTTTIMADHPPILTEARCNHTGL